MTTRTRIRPEIQGLRALAVALVVAFHLRPHLVPGGYVGVDVFFVISGFLITSHLLAEVDRTGTISLPRFWARRVRRLLPAAFTVLAASTVAVLVWLPRSLWERSLAELGASAVYAQNWLLAGNAVDYLAAENKPSLVQHFWSLSTEEQFYLVWPVLVLGALLLAKRRRAIPIVLGVVLALSLGTSIVWTATQPAAAYFVTPTRAWEFAAGGLLAFAPALRPQWRIAASWLGIGGIAVAAFALNGSTPFPGAVALLPVVGTALVVWAGETEGDWSLTTLARFGPAQWIGGLSYAIYLWHWPLIVLYPSITGQQSISTKGLVAILGLSILLAAATKRWIEDPVRNARGVVQRPAAAFGFMAVGMAVVLGVTAGVSSVLTMEVRQQQAAVLAAVQRGAGCVGASAMVPANGCDRPFAVTGTVDPLVATADIPWETGAFSKANQRTHCAGEVCSWGPTAHPSLTVALVGDSHAQMLIDPLVEYASTRGWRVLAYTRSGCSALVGQESVGAVAAADIPKHKACETFSRSIADSLAERRDVDLVLYTNYTARSIVDGQQADRVLTRLREAGRRVVLLRDVPGPPEGQEAPQCVEQHGHAYDPCATARKPATDAMVQIGRRNAVPVLDLSRYFCDATRCHTVIGGTIAYFDSNHLTGTFARTLSPFLGQAVQRLARAA